MKKIDIIVKETKKCYPVYIGTHLLEKIPELINLNQYSQIVVITDTNIQKYFLDTIIKSMSKKVLPIIIPAGEKKKNIDSVIHLWTQFQNFKLDRKSFVINVGGGVITDMGGFAACTFLRGIDFLQIPTTLLSQVDASVGGKVGINFNDNKNYIGSFQQPIGVIVDVLTLKTLPERVFLEGFGEIIKHGLIADKNYFYSVISKNPREFADEELVKIITRSVEIKKGIVEQDEKESGIRKLLNFGHTIGHAMESLSLQTDTPLLHGEAVLFGMMVETKISELAGVLSAKDATIIQEKLLKIALLVVTKKINKEDIIEKIKADKKNNNNKINWTLLDGIGHAVYDKQVDEDIVREALKTVI